MILLFGFTEKHRDELVAAFAYLAARLLEGHTVAELLERVLPGAGVQVHGIDERTVDVEDGGFCHGSELP